MDIHQVRKIYGIMALAAVILVGFAPVVGMVISRSLFIEMLILGFIMAILSIVFAWKKYRCPYCDEILRAREPMPDCCPNCGARLRE